MIEIENTMNTTLLETSLIDAIKLRVFADLLAEFEEEMNVFEESLSE